MDLKVIRGDTQFYKFQRLDKEGNPITDTPDQIYFTVKNKTLPQKYELQKTIEDMAIDEAGYWHFKLLPEDTDSLNWGDYMYDLEIIHDDVTKTVAIGKFTVMKEVTFAQNEG